MPTQFPGFVKDVFTQSFQSEPEVFTPKSASEKKVKQIAQESIQQPTPETYNQTQFFTDIDKVQKKESIDTEQAARAVMNAYKSRGITVEGIPYDDVLIEAPQEEVVEEDTNKTFLGRIGESIEKRTEQRQDIAESDRNFFRKSLDKLAVGAGSFSDIVGAVVGEGFETSGQLVSAITPDSFEEKVKDKVSDAVEFAIESQPGQDLGTFLGETGKGAKFVFELLPEDVQQDVESLGTVGLGILDAAGTNVALKQAGKIAGRKTFLTQAKRDAFIVKETEKVNKAIGQISQPGKKQLGDVGAMKKSISSVDTTDVKTYDDLTARFDDKIKAIATKQDELLPSDKIYNIEDLATKSKKGTIEVNFIDNALGDMEKLYNKTGEIDNLERIRELRAGQLSVKDINDIAREYNVNFGKKAFNKDGTAKFSDIGQAFENTRKGVKETSRGLLPDDVVKTLDSELSDLFTAKNLSDDMASKVAVLKNKLDERGFVANLSNKAGKILDIITLGAPKELFSSLLLKGGMGKATLDSLTLQNRLSKSIKTVEKAMLKIEKAQDARVVSEALEELGKSIGLTREAINAQAAKGKEALGGALDDLADKTGARAKFIDDRKNPFGDNPFTSGDFKPLKDLDSDELFRAIGTKDWENIPKEVRLYRGIKDNKDFDLFEGDFLTKNKNIAKNFAGKNGRVKEFKVKTNDLEGSTFGYEEVIYKPKK